MGKNHNQKSNQPTLLESFPLKYEFDQSWDQIMSGDRRRGNKA